VSSHTRGKGGLQHLIEVSWNKNIQACHKKFGKEEMKLKQETTSERVHARKPPIKAIPY